MVLVRRCTFSFLMLDIISLLTQQYEQGHYSYHTERYRGKRRHSSRRNVVIIAISPPLRDFMPAQ
jgi:hypothetical protein